MHSTNWLISTQFLVTKTTAIVWWMQCSLQEEKFPVDNNLLGIQKITSNLHPRSFYKISYPVRFYAPYLSWVEILAYRNNCFWRITVHRGIIVARIPGCKPWIRRNSIFTTSAALFCSCFLTRYPYILSEVQSLHLSRLTSSMLPSQNKKLPTDS